MRFLYPLIPALMFFSGLAFLFAGETQKQEQKAFKLRPTHESLQARQDKSRESLAERQVEIKIAEPVATEKREGPDPSSLIKRSAVLSSGRDWTIVPKGAVLHVPEHYQARVNGKRVGKLIPWKTFYTQNRGWIHVHSVSMSQARGEEKIDPKQVEAYKSVSRVVISVCHGGPISVIAPKVEEVEKELDPAGVEVKTVSTRK